MRGSRRLMVGVCWGLCAGLWAGCAGLVPSTQGRPRPKDEAYSKDREDDLDRDARSTAQADAGGGLRRKIKQRPYSTTPDEERQKIYDDIIAQDGPARVSHSVKTDLDAWQSEAAKQEEALRKLEMRVANDDDLIRELKNKRDNAYAMVDKYRQLNVSVGEGGGRRSSSGLVVDPLEFDAPGTVAAGVRKGGAQWPEMDYPGTGPRGGGVGVETGGSDWVAAKAVPAPAAGGGARSTLAASTGYYHSRGVADDVEWTTKDEE